MIEYYDAPDVKRKVDEVIELLRFTHIPPESVFCVRSRGSKAGWTIARIHGISKIWQRVMSIPPSYIIEVISEKFDKRSEEDKERTLIHELLHIPEGFQGGFRPHKGCVTRDNVEMWYRRLQQRREEYTPRIEIGSLQAPVVKRLGRESH